MSESPQVEPCCERCPEFFLPVSGHCRLLEARDLNRWLEDARPCRVTDMQVRRVVRKWRRVHGEVEDLVQQSALKLLQLQRSGEGWVPPVPREAFLWVRTIARRVAIDEFRETAKERRGVAARRFCRECSFFERARQICQREFALDPHSSSLQMNPLFNQRVDPQGQEPCAAGGVSFYEPRLFPKLTSLDEANYPQGASDPAADAVAAEAWARLGAINREAQVALALLRHGDSTEEIAERLGLGVRKTYRLLDLGKKLLLEILEEKDSR